MGTYKMKPYGYRLLEGSVLDNTYVDYLEVSSAVLMLLLKVSWVSLMLLLEVSWVILMMII